MKNEMKTKKWKRCMFGNWKYNNYNNFTCHPASDKFLYLYQYKNCAAAAIESIAAKKVYNQLHC